MKMNTIMLAFFQFSLAILASSLARAQPSTPVPGEAGPYHVSQTFHVGGEGAWDYLTVDPEHQLLYVPRSTHTMVLDARENLLCWSWSRHIRRPTIGGSNGEGSD